MNNYFSNDVQVTEMRNMLMEQNYVDSIRKNRFYNNNDQISQNLMNKVGINVQQFKNKMQRNQDMDNWTYSWFCFVYSLDQDQLEILGY